MEFWQSLILQIAGPLTTALVGTLVIGLFAQSITRRAQDRRAKYRLRATLIRQMTEVASRLYIETKLYEDKRHEREATREQLRESRTAVDEQYRVARVSGEVLVRQLEAYFESDEPWRLWHAAMELLTVRYYQLLEQADHQRLQAYVGAEHTELTLEELKEPEEVRRNYHQKLRAATKAVARDALIPPH